jgi:hypothetical protein
MIIGDGCGASAWRAIALVASTYIVVVASLPTVDDLVPYGGDDETTIFHLSDHYVLQQFHTGGNSVTGKLVVDSC